MHKMVFRFGLFGRLGNIAGGLPGAITRKAVPTPRLSASPRLHAAEGKPKMDWLEQFVLESSLRTPSFSRETPAAEGTIKIVKTMGPD